MLLWQHGKICVAMVAVFLWLRTYMSPTHGISGIYVHFMLPWFLKTVARAVPFFIYFHSPVGLHVFLFLFNVDQCIQTFWRCGFYLSKILHFPVKCQSNIYYQMWVALSYNSVCCFPKHITLNCQKLKYFQVFSLCVRHYMLY